MELGAMSLETTVLQEKYSIELIWHYSCNFHSLKHNLEIGILKITLFHNL